MVSNGACFAAIYQFLKRNNAVPDKAFKYLEPKTAVGAVTAVLAEMDGSSTKNVRRPPSMLTRAPLSRARAAAFHKRSLTAPCATLPTHCPHYFQKPPVENEAVIIKVDESPAS